MNASIAAAAKRHARLATGIAVVVGASLVVGIQVRTIGGWNPAHSADTIGVYYPTLQKFDHHPGAGPLEWLGWFVEPFFRPAGQQAWFIAPFLLGAEPGPPEDQPDAAHAKPVFVCLLRAWHMAYLTTSPAPRTLPDANVYSLFVIASSVAAYLAIVHVGATLGSPTCGMLAGIAALAGPWGMFTCHFFTYTATSMALYGLAYSLCLRGTRRSCMAAGLLTFALLMCNQSLVALVAALPLAICFRRRDDHEGSRPSQTSPPSLSPSAIVRRWWRGSRLLTHYVAAAALPFVLLESSAILASSLSSDSSSTHGPLVVLQEYLGRGSRERSEYYSAYDRSFFLDLLRFDNGTGSLLGGGVILCFAASCGIDWLRSRSGTSTERPPIGSLWPVAMAALPACVGLLVIEMKPGLKFSRSYFLCYPFLLLSALLAGQALLSRLRLRIAMPLALACGAVVLAEAAARLSEFDRTFNAVAVACRELREAGHRVATLDEDYYARFLQLMSGTPLPSVSAAALTPSVADFVITGPPTPSALEFAPDTPLQVDLSRMHRDRVEFVRDIPFFSHYAYLTYDDPYATYLAVVERRIKVDDFRTSAGSAELYRVVVPTPADGP